MGNSTSIPSSTFDVKRTFNPNGTFSKVHLICHKTDKKKLKAAREIVLPKLFPAAGPEVLQMLADEAEKLNRYGYATIVRIFSIIKADATIYCLMEYCEGGNLEQYLMKRKGELLEEDQIRRWFSQLVLGINYLHDQKLPHCDLTAQNLYLKIAKPTGDDGDDEEVTGPFSIDLKIGDFSIDYLKQYHHNHEMKQLSNLNNQQQHLRKMPTPMAVVLKPENICYFPPEIISGKSHGGEKEDVWSMGIILFQMAALVLPYKESRKDILLGKIDREERDARMSEKMYSHDMLTLGEKLLQVEPSKRPKVGQVLKDKFLRAEVATLAGGRGKTAIQRDEERKQEIANHKPKVAGNQTANELDFTGYLDKLISTKDRLITSPWFSTRTAVVDLLILHPPANQVLAVCADGELIALKNNPKQNVADVLWRGYLKVPQSVSLKTTVANAACDSSFEYAADVQVYFSLIEDRSGVFQANCKTLIQQYPLNVQQPPSTTADLFVFEKRRSFGGLAVSQKNQILLSCDCSLRYDISVWSLKTKLLLTRISHPAFESAEFRPSKCALLCNQMRIANIAVTDFDKSSVYLFKIKLDSLDGESVETLLESANNGPRGVFIDFSGKFCLVADEKSQHVEAYDIENSKLVATWATRNSTLLKIKIPAVGILLEADDSTVPFIVQSFSWQRKIEAYFLPP